MRLLGYARLVAGTCLLAVLAACAAPQTALAPPEPRLLVPDVSGPMQCVPFARMVSGIAIRGNAWTWWGQADGEFAKSHKPEVGSVLVLRKTPRLRYGHVAVVSSVEGPRRITVAHSNWGWNRATRARIHTAMPVIDVSPANDWSQVRFKDPSVATFGRIYPAHGFILPEHDGIQTVASR